MIPACAAHLRLAAEPSRTRQINPIRAPVTKRSGKPAEPDRAAVRAEGYEVRLASGVASSSRVAGCGREP
jgi:hypothetical protein